MSQDEDIEAAGKELSMAMGNPALEVGEKESFAGALMREAARRFTEKAQVPVLRASPLTASEANALIEKRRIAGGVYSNPQPGDADFPGETKMDIGSGG